MSDSEDRKWSCEYCTYENYPATKRCTLCRGPRPVQLITNSPSQEQDIYKMAPLVTPLSSESNHATTSSSSELNKWACHMCTYLNWQRATKCTQCLTPRKKLSPSRSQPTSHHQQQQQHEKMQPLSVNVNIAESSAPPISGRTTPKRNSPNSPEAAKAINNDINKAVAAHGHRSGTKWICRACTYENWPKGIKCILCGTAKGRTFSDTNLASGGSYGLICEQEGGNRRGRASPGMSQSLDNIENYQDGASASASSFEDKNRVEERRLRLLRKRLRDKDWLWLSACSGVVDGDSNAVEAFIASGGDPARQLTQDEVTLLNRPSAFEVGYTLVHLGIRFKREDMLAVLLTATDVAAKAVKRLPAHTSPDLATDIRREIASSLRQRKGDFPCFFFTDCVTFALPTDIEDLPRHIQGQLFDELLDRDVQSELEEESIVNWNVELTDRLGSRLYSLWNRTAGDCLLDSLLQATWGVFDIDNTLRRALADSLSEGAMTFYPRWKEYESMQARSLHFSLDESQCQRDWALLLSLASQPGASLEQTHIFALAHILRRPIIVYGVKYVKSFRGETIGFAKFQGVYLPLLWERSFCWKIPMVLGYTRGHFSALVPMEMDTDDSIGAGANIESNDDGQVAYLPLVDNEGKLLPVHFLTGSEVGREDTILREWLDCVVTKGGILVAAQKLGKRPALVKQMVEEWLDHYRQLSHGIPPTHQTSLSSQTFSSDGESDQE
ncbi:ubiquitin thioesterase zranb1-like [Haliotis rufescens]|uniref:ubiquitin thioesterase zranb1-like n=1 Tax=Haliotis rufescens TaxID=6454 RepID=UPI001EB0133D|nr:ubiquitin thioesterase zranb1-like [Haliotis rufescens]